MTSLKTFLVFGATGQTGRHFTSLALADGHRVRALVRTPSRVEESSPNLEVHQGSITEPLDLHSLLDEVDYVVCLLGDAQLQATRKVNTVFVQQLIPAMRRQNVTRFLYQAGGLSAPPNHKLPLVLKVVRSTVARKFIGQHRDNEAVMQYLVDTASDIEWMVHRAAIGSDGPTRGTLRRSAKKVSIATFSDVAAYNYNLLLDPSAIHTSDLSAY